MQIKDLTIKNKNCNNQKKTEGIFLRYQGREMYFIYFKQYIKKHKLKKLLTFTMSKCKLPNEIVVMLKDKQQTETIYL